MTRFGMHVKIFGGEVNVEIEGSRAPTVLDCAYVSREARGGRALRAAGRGAAAPTLPLRASLERAGRRGLTATGGICILALDIHPGRGRFFALCGETVLRAR